MPQLGTAAGMMADMLGEVERLRAENEHLRAQLAAVCPANGQQSSAEPAEACLARPPAFWDGLQHGLSKEEVGRYSRQLILHSFGVHGEARQPWV